MNTLLYFFIALTTLATPATDFSKGAFSGIEMTWSIAFNAAIAVLEERVAQHENEEAITDVSEDADSEIIENEETYVDSKDYTKADVAYWNGLAIEYGFQPFNGFGDFSQFVESAKLLVYNAETYGNPYYEDQGLQAYYENEDGVLIENPVYDHRWGPNDNSSNQVESSISEEANGT